MEHAEVGRDLYASGDDPNDFFLLQSATVDMVRDATAIEPECLIYHGGPGEFPRFDGAVTCFRSVQG